MRVAIDLKHREMGKELLETLEERKFRANIGSFGTVMVYDIKYVEFKFDELVLTTYDYRVFSISMDGIERFETQVLDK